MVLINNVLFLPWMVFRSISLLTFVVLNYCSAPLKKTYLTRFLIVGISASFNVCDGLKSSCRLFFELRWILILLLKTPKYYIPIRKKHHLVTSQMVILVSQVIHRIADCTSNVNNFTYVIFIVKNTKYKLDH